MERLYGKPTALTFKRVEYDTFEDALKNTERFIEDVYNEKRMHSVPGYLSPMEFETEEALKTLA